MLYIQALYFLLYAGCQHLQSIEVCRCQPLAVTLYEYGLWPSTPSNPHIALTLDFMKTLKGVVLESQISLRAYCTALQSSRWGLKVGATEEYVSSFSDCLCLWTRTQNVWEVNLLRSAQILELTVLT